MSRSLRSLGALGAIAAIVLSACGGGADSAPSAQSADAPKATGEKLEGTITEGKLTIATGEPAYVPWVKNDAPESGEGFEAAVAYAVAEELGYAKEDVVWVRSTFDSAIAPGAKDWDFNLQQFSITDERKKAVDFSSPYYTTSQAVLTVKGSPAENAKSVAELKKVSFGVQTGSTSAEFLASSVPTDQEPRLFNNNADVVQALKGGQVDAIVVDLPTAFFISATQLDDKGVIVGQFAATEGGDNYGLVLPKDSKLTPAVTKAVDTLRENGKLAELQEKWLSADINVPVLK